MSQTSKKKPKDKFSEEKYKFDEEYLFSDKDPVIYKGGLYDDLYDKEGIIKSKSKHKGKAYYRVQFDNVIIECISNVLEVVKNKEVKEEVNENN